ncbi:sensor histidine kinase [Hellea balneolensis]|uniref:sensor histidine kinase n=1 Tax=Hellea balneolensis TaxID=287478 RepID=UPI0003F62876|nr:HAMP domain-containing sensor histidine kinase [Hellea balneolensis]
MIEGFISRRLSGKLLLMTIGFVMLAELVIFVPSAATFRQDWLNDRAQQAGLLAQALTGVPDYEASQILTDQFMRDTDVIMMSAKRDGMSEFMLGSPPESAKLEMIDLRETRRLPRYRDAFRTFFGSAEGCLRVMAASPVAGQDALELLIPKSKLQWAMRDYAKRIAVLSLAIAIITGLLIYLAMLFMIIRPIEKLASGLADFREDPEIRRSNLPPSGRKDEIGQLQREFYDMKQGVRASFKQRERLATLGMAVAKINHDLRNVLASASLVSDRLASDPEERISKMGARLTRSIDRGIKLTSEVLNFSLSGQDEADLDVVRISLLVGEAAGDTLGSFGTGARRISFTNKIPSEMIVTADKDHTYRIFHNLFRNAAQAMAKMPEDDAIRNLTVEAIPAGDHISILVKDTGLGLPDKAKDNLFKAFASASGRGSTGLGLTISQDLAREQGGDIVLESTSENGTIFAVSLQKA